MNNLECIGESPKHPSNEVIGQDAIEGPDGVKAKPLIVRPRKGSTVPVAQMVTEFGKLEVASESASLQEESASLSPTKPSESKASYTYTTREYSGSSIPVSQGDVAYQTTPVSEQAESATVFSQSLLQVCREGTGAQACSQDQAGSLPEPEEEEEDSDDESKAPVELLAEFLKAVMEQDYVLGKKLCEMILIYEPEHPEATQFLPLIKDKLRLAGHVEEDESSDDMEDSSDSSDSKSSEGSDISASAGD
ncbi:hypothetical protein AAFF_G00344560 [Aldrovandia affinis]|uniref:Glutamate-rich protein 2 n=1 Tax=Aldrovandia affinis TaxID=143900 RepID=A0AAD7SMB1_9TELE|nr:hypothetical protein AAFF_G00344560 [Aldrovandia affinis]